MLDLYLKLLAFEKAVELAIVGLFVAAGLLAMAVLACLHVSIRLDELKRKLSKGKPKQ